MERPTDFSEQKINGKTCVLLQISILLCSENMVSYAETMYRAALFLYLEMNVARQGHRW